MNTLKAEKRSMDVKAKKLRREGYVTGNLFGREIEGSIPLKFTKKEIEVLLKNNNKGSQVVSGVLQDELKEVAYKALPADLVDKIKVDVAGMKIGDTLRVKDLEIAKNKNIHITTDLESVIATVTPVHNVVPEAETATEDAAEEK